MMVSGTDLGVWEGLTPGEEAYCWLSSGKEKMSGMPKAS